VLQGASTSYRATIKSTCTAAPAVKYVSVPKGTAHAQADGVRQLLHDGTEDGLVARAHFVGVPWTCLDADLDVPCYSPSSHYPALFGCAWHKAADGTEHSKVGQKLAEIEAERIPNTSDGELVGYAVYLDCSPPVPNDHSSALTLTLTVTHRGQPILFQGADAERTFVIGLIPPPSVPPPSPPYIAPPPSPPPPVGYTASSWSQTFTASGWGSVNAVRFQSVTGSGGTYRFDWPLANVGACGGWRALHSGCGNVNGQNGCTAVCTAMGMSFSSLNTNCGSGYPSGVSPYASTCAYKGGSGNPGSWTCSYGSGALGCGNPMNFCSCSGSLPSGMLVD